MASPYLLLICNSNVIVANYLIILPDSNLFPYKQLQAFPRLFPFRCLMRKTLFYDNRCPSFIWKKHRCCPPNPEHRLPQWRSSLYTSACRISAMSQLFSLSRLPVDSSASMSSLPDFNTRAIARRYRPPLESILGRRRNWSSHPPFLNLNSQDTVSPRNHYYNLCSNLGAQSQCPYPLFQPILGNHARLRQYRTSSAAIVLPSSPGADSMTPNLANMAYRLLLTPGTPSFLGPETKPDCSCSSSALR